VVSPAQLGQLGFTRGEIQARVERGEWIRVARNVLLVGAPAVEGRGHLYVAQLRGGPDSFLSHRTALAAHGLRRVARSHLEVTIVGAARKRQGLKVHRIAEAPDSSEVVARFGLRYSSVPRALCELAAQKRAFQEVEATLLGAVRRNLVDMRALQATIERHAGDRGITIVRGVASRYTDTEDRSSQLEHAFDAHAAADPRIPHYERNVRMGPFEFDCVFEPQRVIVELDGRAYHQAVQDMEKDRAKDIYAQLHGFRIMRVTDARWEHDRAGAVEDLLALLALETRLQGDVRSRRSARG
jgi:very-short-patch-repair endonuclease